MALMLGGIVAAWRWVISRYTDSVHVNNNPSSHSSQNVRTVGKITYNVNSRLDNERLVYEGKFEKYVTVAVKKIRVHENDQTQITEDLDSLLEKQRRVVKTNHTLSNINTINIVKFFCYEIETQHSRTYLLLALELCTCNLDQLIQSRQSYPSLSNNGISLQLTTGLDFLHSHSIVHRDLKPSNVLIRKVSDDKYIVKLSDFGLSKEIQSSSSATPDERVVLSGPLCGTANWMAPEIYKQLNDPSILDKSFWKRSDIFSLGLILYYVASDGSYVFSSQEDIQNDKSDFTKISENYPLEHLMRQMLSPQHTDRPYTDTILKHPAYWESERILKFFKETSNLLTNVLLKDKQLLDQCHIEDNAVDILGGNWQRHLTTDVRNDLFPCVRNNKSGPKYNKISVQSLIRAIRNNKEHYNDAKMSALRSAYGSYPHGYLSYWTSRFPELLMHTYNKMQVLDSMEIFYK